MAASFNPNEIANSEIQAQAQPRLIPIVDLSSQGVVDEDFGQHLLKWHCIQGDPLECCDGILQQIITCRSRRDSRVGDTWCGCKAESTSEPHSSTRTQYLDSTGAGLNEDRVYWDRLQ